MGDQDFNFAPPPPRRERKEFEPPPWEKDQFDQLARERGATTGEAEQQTSAEPVSEQRPAAAAVTGSAEEPHQVPVAPKATPAGEVDDRKVAAMLFELKAEDGPATVGMHRVALVAGAVLLVVGVVLVIWAIVMVVVAMQHPEQGRTGVFVGLTVLLFGVGFVGAAAWFVFRTLRLQGVL